MAIEKTNDAIVGFDRIVIPSTQTYTEYAAQINATWRYGIRNEEDAVNFLRTEWINNHGMNNILLYASGVYQQAGKTAPYTGTNTVSSSSRDKLTNQLNGSVTTADWRASGSIASTTNLSPTRGEIYVVQYVGRGAPAANTNRPFNFPSVANQLSSGSNSFLGPGAMWIGDTPKKRAIWSAGNAINANTLSTNGGLPFPTTKPYVAGSPNNSTYTESGQAGPAYNDPATNIVIEKNNIALNQLIGL